MRPRRPLGLGLYGVHQTMFVGALCGGKVHSVLDHHKAVIESHLMEPLALAVHLILAEHPALAVSLWATALVDTQSALNAVGELVLRVRCCASTGHLILGVGRRTVAVSKIWRRCVSEYGVAVSSSCCLSGTYV